MDPDLIGVKVCYSWLIRNMKKQLNFDPDSVAILMFQSFPLRGSKKPLNMGEFNCFL